MYDSTNPAGDNAQDGVLLRQDWTDLDDLSVAVCDAIAVANGLDPYDVPPLYESVDVESLEPLVSADRDTTLTFTHAGCHVVVNGDGLVHARRVGDGQ